MKTISYDPRSGGFEASYRKTSFDPRHKSHARAPADPVERGKAFGRGKGWLNAAAPLKSPPIECSLKAIAHDGKTMVSHRIQGDCFRKSVRWNPVSNARVAASGMSPRWMSPPEAGKATWKTARFAANQMRCGLNTILRRRNSSSQRRWSDWSAKSR